ncbi:restriction endonuclease [Asticcacaulis machinosus]|uniref:Restriction endonuclease n=1 Tax=Asticcacaulis machinosus TaxID=2984211 RepID=A0ABT5HJP2_9CAUL|nr:restriction endonuclease [Asticcacaulis machinosus]MDC7676223.1 restriction endonuclease [Asticcacaulis machinosus]
MARLQNVIENGLSVDVPTYDRLIWPTLKALRALGGSGSNEEIYDKIIENEGFSEEIQQVPMTGHNKGKLEYNSFWARTYLKKYDAINSSGRGVWVLLEKGESLTEADCAKIPAAIRKLSYSNRKGSGKAKVQDLKLEEPNETDIIDWKDQLLTAVQNIPPSSFERLCQRILRENGFTKVEVTGKSGDGGIDGVGIYRVNLISFHVSFQCKRYQGSVGAGHIRDFRGAMIGRGDKGLFITTGTFTSEARKEASRDGAPAIDLIDGEELCVLLKSLQLGVKTEMIESVSVQTEWFNTL